jgi:hypothetical protein
VLLDPRIDDSQSFSERERDLESGSENRSARSGSRKHIFSSNRSLPGSNHGSINEARSVSMGRDRSKDCDSGDEPSVPSLTKPDRLGPSALVVGNSAQSNDGAALTAAALSPPKSPDASDITDQPISNEPEISRLDDLPVVHKPQRKTRTKSLVGTLAYMAPEVILLAARKQTQPQGYTAAVDWWSLGCTIFKLLTGHEPFRLLPFETVCKRMPSLLTKLSYPDTFTVLFGALDLHGNRDLICPDAANIISRLMEFDAAKRLGSETDETNTTAALKAHPFFAGLNWDAIEDGTIEPPYLPESEVRDLGPVDKEKEKEDGANAPKMFTLNEMLTRCGKSAWVVAPSPVVEPKEEKSGSFLSGFKFGGSSKGKKSASVAPAKVSEPNKLIVKEEQQLLFADWGYVSPEAIEQEAAAVRLANSTKVNDAASTRVVNAMGRMISGLSAKVSLKTKDKYVVAE